jgi:hypothetical protein
MGEHICYLITILNGTELLQCALRVKRDSISSDCQIFPMEPENRRELHEMLPLHVKSCGPIVEITEIFEITIKEAT